MQQNGKFYVRVMIIIQNDIDLEHFTKQEKKQNEKFCCNFNDCRINNEIF